MKTPVILLSLLCAALAAGLFLSRNKSQKALDEALKRNETYSNEVAQINTKLLLNQGVAQETQTNLQGRLDQRTAELLNASNVVAQVRAMLVSAQEDSARLQRELQTAAERIGALEAHRDALSRRVESLQVAEQQLGGARETLRQMAVERDVLVKSSQRLELELAGLQRKLNDLSFLRLQTERVEAGIEAAKREARGRSGGRPDFDLPITMLPNGSVQLVPPGALDTAK